MNARRCAAVMTLLVAGCGGSSDASKPDGGAPSEAAKPAQPAAAAAAAPDPMKDAAAWKALPAAERAAKAAKLVADTDAGDAAALEKARAFLKERGEDTSIGELGKAAIARGSTAAWARQAAGQADLAAEVDAALKSSELADDGQVPEFVVLKGMRSKFGSSWWADAETVKRVRGLVADLKKAEARLQTPYGQAVEKWARWQRAIPVMQDSPALYGARGPYLVFVSLNAAPPAGEKPKSEAEAADAARHAKVPTLAEVPAAERERGAKILAKNLDLMERFYDGWLKELGPIFGFDRYDEKNSDDRTLFKMNVFATSADYQRYNAKTGGGMGGFARAYYSNEEPRFITTYDGGADKEDEFSTDQTQCHEATHQLVHFYTWDLSRKALKRDIRYIDCFVRPTWSNEGFAEFFSSYAVKDGKYVWMQPLMSRMQSLYVLDDVLKGKSWAPWGLKEFLSVRDAGQLIDLGRIRAGKQQADQEMAEGVMGDLFYADAWSFVHFLWYAQDAAGKPKYRDRYIEYLKTEFHLTFKYDKLKATEAAVLIGINDFRRILSVETDDKLLALEKEWREFEGKLLEKHKVPAWDDLRSRIRKHFKLDK